MTNFEALIRNKNELEDAFREWKDTKARKYAGEAVAALETMIYELPVVLLEKENRE